MKNLNENQQEKVCGAGGLLLPEAFCNRMKQELGGEAEAFLASYRAPRQQALRLNPAKYGRAATASEAEAAKEAAALVAEVLETAPEQLEPVPWASYAYYYAEEQRPGRNPLHDAGLYYIQEPSAMATVGELESYLKKTGRTGPFRALDLCAAPGGKSTQLLTMLREMDGKRAAQEQSAQCSTGSILVSNEIIPSRAAILSENLERFGAVGAIVTNESPEKLAGRFPSWFDLIIVDAPCSGEGMFRKEEAAVREWSPENVAMCAQRQKQILEQAAVMLADGGVLAYSTCTFSREENEENTAWLTETHPELKPVMTRRLYPHEVRGEGHFVALFQKDGVPAGSARPTGFTGSGKARNNSKLTEPVNAWNAFAKELFGPDSATAQDRKGADLTQLLRSLTPDRAVCFGEELSLLPDGLSAPQLAGLKVMRPGLHLGTLRKNRFEPSHALALALTYDEVINSFELSGEQALRYLRGETIPLEPAQPLKGWVLVTYRGVSLGWGKAAGSILKNHYPKGLRRLS